MPGQSFLVSDDESKKLLRDLRRTFLQEQEKQYPREPGIQIVGGRTLYMRDEIPLADADGLIALGSRP